jgi:endonuclease/exonuclease/phosphatase family metal-dependent hydrolase
MEAIMRETAVFVSCVLVVCGMWFVSCTDAAQAASLSVLTWNVEALFDGNDDGIEYKEYREDQGWNEEKYRARLTAIAGVFDQMERVPDIALFIELENQAVLDLLAGTYLAKHGYQQGYFAKKQGQALGMGVLSRYPVTKMLCHGSVRDGNAIPRPVSEIWIEAGGEELVLLVCHWKSKLGEAEKSRTLRRDAALLIKRICGEIAADREAGGKPPVPILLAGDFNQTAAEFFTDDFPFVVTNVRDDFGKGQDDRDSPLFWTPWGTEMEGGSYYYRGEWESIDHFFLSGAFFDGRAWEYGGSAVLREAPWTGGDGIPRSFNARSGDGLSDHVPRLLTLTAQRDSP